MPRRILALLAILLLVPIDPADAQDIAAAIRDGRWMDADLLAAQSPDPVARKLVTYFRLLTPGGGSATEIADFIDSSPDWPAQASLLHHRDEALAAEPDDQVAAKLCQSASPQAAAALARCANAYAQTGALPAATAAARAAWTDGITEPAAEAAFVARWAGVLTAADQAVRFDHLAWSAGSGVALRQIGRLDPAARPGAEALLALKRDDPSAETRLLALPQAQQREPSLMLEYARWLRHAGRESDAAALWTASGDAAQRAAPADRLPAFWTERNILARHRLRDGDPQAAYALAAAHSQSASEQVADAEFLAGFIALRKLNDPARARRHFQTLADQSKAAITRGRAHYWLARTEAAGGDARAGYAAAAAYPTTFYGQLAALALGEDAPKLRARILTTHDPGWDRERVLAFAGREVTRAAALLVAWGEARRARAFILRLDELAPDPPDRALAARLALGFGLPDEAVAVARRAGRDGLMLPDSGWPMPVEPPATEVEPAITLGLIRQESSFDTQAVSPSGARGLMQLMPATAQTVAKQVGAPATPAALTTDADYNMRLGTAYLRGVLDQFDQALPLALAAYNAGPNRVQDWLGENGDPRAPGQTDPRAAGATDMVDWIELIPFSETRNYVQRVIENVVIYRAKRGDAAAHPLTAAAR